MERTGIHIRAKKKAAGRPLEVRDLVFADLSLDELVTITEVGEPWDSYRAAKTSLDRGDRQTSFDILEKVTRLEGLESRHYAQAWHLLRELDVEPPIEKGKQVYGVIVEVGMKSGLDVLAAYADYKARYYNFSGAAVVWEHPDASLDPLIRAMLEQAELITPKLWPWSDLRPAPPPAGHSRISMLTPSGLHFGHGPLTAMETDPLGGPMLIAAKALMQKLIEIAKRTERSSKSG